MNQGPASDPSQQPAPTPARLAEVVAAVAAERDATPGEAPLVLGPARADPARSTSFVRAFVVDTGPRRLGDTYLGTLHLDHVDGRRVVPSRTLFWEADRLRGETLELAFNDAADTADADSACGWQLTAENNDHEMLRALAWRLTTTSDPGAGRCVLEASMKPLATPGLRVVCGPTDKRHQHLVTQARELIAADQRILVVAAQPIVLDELTLALARALDPPAAVRPHPAGGGLIIRVGIPAMAAVGEDPRLTLDGQMSARLQPTRAELDSWDLQLPVAASALGEDQPSAASPLRRPVPPTDADLALASHTARTATEARRVAAAANGQAAAEHSRARQSLRALEPGRQALRRVEELARGVVAASASSGASALGVGRLADLAGDAAAHGNTDQHASRLRQLLVAAEVAATRLSERDGLLSDLDEGLAHVRRLGVARRDIEHGTAELRRARAHHAVAARALLDAQAGEIVAQRGLDSVVGARLETDAAPGREAGGPPVSAPGRDGSATGSGATPAQRARLSALDQAVQQRFHTNEVLVPARLVLATAKDVIAGQDLAEHRFDHVLVEGAATLSGAALCFVASLADGGVTLYVDPELAPPTPRTTSVEHQRWLAVSVLDLLALRDAEGHLIDHPRLQVLT